MGILNCTPDSFYDGGKYGDGVDRALQMVDAGADWLDIGGESTRPGAESVSVEEELNRVIPVIQKIRQHSKISISIDTTKALVAQAALEAGANMINDVSGLSSDPEMISVALHYKCPVILMHRRGDPKTMQSLANYQDVVKEVVQELELLCDRALAGGIKRENILIDPGFGFAKTAEQNWILLSHLEEFKKIGFPLVVGLSRKSFIGNLLNQEKPEERLNGSLACTFWAVQKGADILRVHDVDETRQIITLVRKLQSS